MATKRKFENPTHEHLRSRYDYDESGFFINKRTKKIVKGSLLTSGYRVIAYRHKYPAQLYHRMIWLWHNGYLPEEIDHKDTIKSNNQIENLRECTVEQNKANRHGNKNRKYGLSFKGVDLHKGKKFRARLIHHGVYIHLGIFDTEEAAGNAYVEAAKKLSGEFARG